MIRRARWAASFLVALAAAPFAGCSRRAVVGAAAEPPTLRTTDGELAAGNLEAELALAERQLRERPASVPRARALVDRVLTHAQYFGRLADYDRAVAIAHAAVALAPRSGEAHLLEARVRSALHEFPAALAELDVAEGLVPARDRVREEAQRARVGVWAATGQVDRALVYLTAWRRDRPDLTSYAAEASAFAQKRDFARAESLFDEARRHYDDVSPFPVAWLEFQEGHMWESAGRLDRAQPLYESAHARLPIYAAAAGHLATAVALFGDPAGLRRAETLLRPLAERGDDPEYVGQLAVVERGLGHADVAERLTREAAERYEALLRLHPEAFYDHAARFYFHVGQDPRRALALAEKNLALRPTLVARELRDDVQRGVSAEALAR